VAERAEEMLPPSVTIDLERDSLISYWRARARQHTQDLYAGVRLSKFPEDLRVYEHLIWLAAPDTVVEIGTQFGASALWFRDRLRAFRSYGRIAGEPRVITVDIDQSNAREALAAADPEFTRDIALVEGDVCDPATAEAVADALGDGRRCLVVEDSAHTRFTTAAALRGFARFVPPGGFFVVEDGCVDVEAMRVSDEWPRGVLPALVDWLQSPAGAEFVVRRDLELYGVSCHPQGFLQRRAESLDDELRSGVGWMYPWELGTPEPLTLLHPELPSVHSTRLELIEDPVRATLAAAEEPTAIDLACSEGWFAHRMLEWGASRVVAIDVREENVRRARVVRNHLGVPPAKLEIGQGDMFALDVGQLGTFDVVLLLGLIYHVENPVGALRVARALTRSLCVVETQLTRQSRPIEHGWGTSSEDVEVAEGSFALRLEEDALHNRLASAPGIASLVPNRAAVEAIVRAAGFSGFEWRQTRPHHNSQYYEGDRGVLLAWP
jgi:cephalosporin hydroxylase